MTSDRLPPPDETPRDPPPAGKAAAREAKLAQALRANLRRRKAEPAKRDDGGSG